MISKRVEATTCSAIKQLRKAHTPLDYTLLLPYIYTVLLSPQSCVNTSSTPE